MKKKLEKWANDALKFYNDLGMSICDEGMDFYGQSSLTGVTESPYLVVCGINPGSPVHSLKEPHDTKYLLEGNTVWGLKDWKLNKVGISDSMIDKMNALLINACFFPSKAAKEVKTVMDDCAPTTIKLIDILKPKRLIILSGNDCMARFKRVIKRDMTSDGFMMDYDFVSFEPNNKILLGKINGVMTLGIPHISARYLKCGKITNVVQAFLTEDFDMDIDTLREAYGKGYVPISMDDVFSKLDKSNFHLYSEDSKTKRYKINGKIALVATKCEKGYFYFRLIDHPNGFDYIKKDWMNKDKILEILIKKHGWLSAPASFAHKNLKEYATLDDCVEELLEISEQLKQC
ncbi:MAG: hypothetical protein PHU58_03375 [Prevotella sp.]|nr:hypothetical protein [Prevotella sp.]